MKTLTVKKLDVMSVANFSAVLAASLAVVMVVLSWVLAMIDYAKLSTYYPNVVEWNTGFGILAVIFVPLMYAAAGWVAGAIVAWFYNVALGNTSGIRVDVEE